MPTEPSESKECIESPQKFFTYILECDDGTFYTGQTSRLAGRVLEHMCGGGARYTKGRLPVRLCYTEQCDSRGDAMRRERQIKKMSREQKKELISRWVKVDNQKF